MCRLRRRTRRRLRTAAARSSSSPTIRSAEQSRASRSNEQKDYEEAAACHRGRSSSIPASRSRAISATRCTRSSASTRRRRPTAAPSRCSRNFAMPGAISHHAASCRPLRGGVRRCAAPVALAPHHAKCPFRARHPAADARRPREGWRIRVAAAIETRSRASFRAALGRRRAWRGATLYVQAEQGSGHHPVRPRYHADAGAAARGRVRLARASVPAHALIRESLPHRGAGDPRNTRPCRLRIGLRAWAPEMFKTRPGDHSGLDP